MSISYDSSGNRVATISGTLQLTAAQGIALAYDGASNRRTATSYQGGTSVTESYTYDENNRLTSTNRGGSLTSSRTYDWANRVTDTVSYSSPGTVSEHRTYAYNAKGWLTQLDVYNASGTHTQRNVYTGGANGYDQSLRGQSRISEKSEMPCLMRPAVRGRWDFSRRQILAIAYYVSDRTASAASMMRMPW